MQKQIIFKIAGFIMIIIATAMIPCLITSIIYSESDMVRAFLFTIIPMLIFGALLIGVTKPLVSTLKTREGAFIVVLCWLLSSLMGAFPYFVSGVLPSFIDSFFESVSGFTTTGASIIGNLESIPKGLILWRSLSHWIGGMGILVFAISILPALGIGAQNIAKAETTGPTMDKVTTRISDNAKVLYLIYIGFSALALILLLIGGLDLFDALIHTFGSMGTGGLSNYEAGIAHFDSLYVEIIVSVFSIFASLNFIAYRQIMNGRIKDFFKHPEIKAFFTIMLVTVGIMTIILWVSNTYDSFASSLRHSFFQITSFMSTSGYVTADYNMWPVIAKFILFLLLFVGGCSASTSGSVKVIRVAVMFKIIKRNFFKKIHPRAVKAVKLSGKPISSEVASNITAFILLYISTFIISALIISLDNLDLSTTFSAAAATLSNTGVGFGGVGPGETFEIFSKPIRFFMCFVMLAGRLELFTLIALLTPSFWRPDNQ